VSIAILFILSACHADPDYTTTQGIDVYLKNGATIDLLKDLDTSIDIGFHELVLTNPGMDLYDMEYAINQGAIYMDIYPLNERLSCGGGSAVGCQNGIWISLTPLSGCWGDSALVHELGHWFLDYTKGYNDVAHQNTEIFGPDAAEGRGDARIRTEICGRPY
jgi:hypothetical protein